LTEFARVGPSETLFGAGSRPGEGQDGKPGPVGGSAVADRRGTPRGTARDRALRLLAARDRSRRELESRLLHAGFHPAEVASAIRALEAVGLIDDERFARALAEHALAVRRSGRRAAIQALLAKGVTREIAEWAVDQVPGHDDGRAEELARLRAPRFRSVDLGPALRRLTDFLIRRGHEPATARTAAARALGEPARDLSEVDD
jgi:regulatory protein